MAELKFKKIYKISVWWDVAFAVAWCMVLLLALWKAPFGFGNCDESFYLVTPLRLLKGDALLYEEWHLSQLGAFLLYPLVAVYMQIVGTTTGIILNFRYIYIGLMALVSIFMYIRLRGKTQPGAGAAAISMFIYAPFGITAMSYNSLGIVMLTLALIIMYTAKRLLRFQQIIAGVFFAASVLCCPYLILVYVAYTLAMLGVFVYRKKTKKTEIIYEVFDVKSWLFFTIGCASLAVVFAAFVFSRASLREIMTALPYMMSDPSHESRSVITILATFVTLIVKTVPYTKWVYAAEAMLLVVVIVDRKRKEHRVLYLGIALVMVITLQVLTRLFYSYINYFQFPVNTLAVFCLLLTPTENIKKLFYYGWIPGILYGLCIHAASNQEFFAISSASTVALGASLLMGVLAGREIYDKDFATAQDPKPVIRTVTHIIPGPETFKVNIENIEEMPEIVGKGHRRLPKALVVIATLILCFGQLGLQGFLRYESVFWEDIYQVQNTAISQGPELGIRTNSENAAAYEDSVKTTEYIREKYPETESVAFFSCRTWMYLLMNDMDMASQSGWIGGIVEGQSETAKESLISYYKTVTEKVPDIMYFDEEFANFAKDFKELFEKESGIMCETETMENGAVILARKTRPEPDENAKSGEKPTSINATEKEIETKPAS